jgi:hypothetical protein
VRRRGRQWCPNKTAPPFLLSTQPGKACNLRGLFLANANFHDRQFERTFRITKSMVEEILPICANADSFFTGVQDITGQFAIAPAVEILMALSQIAYGCCPTAFVDYFQMSETTGRLCLIKFSRLVPSHEALRSVYLRQMTQSDACRVTAIHKAQHSVEGMLGSLDCMHIY